MSQVQSTYTARYVQALLLLLFFAVMWVAQRDGSEKIYLSPYSSLACAIAVLFFSYSSAFSDTVFGYTPMRLLGAWSFAIYLIHEPFLQTSERLTEAGVIDKGLAYALAFGAAITTAAIVHICF
jgi:peptidoglycan/LPS O-acetylase OafA/YrhL